MTLLEKLQSHKGGLLRLKSDLSWYDGRVYGRVYDNIPSRICLLLDAADPAADPLTHAAVADLTAAGAWVVGARYIGVHLLIDGSHRWVWVTEEDVEVIVETR